MRFFFFSMAAFVLVACGPSNDRKVDGLISESKFDRPNVRDAYNYLEKIIDERSSIFPDEYLPSCRSDSGVDLNCGCATAYPGEFIGAISRVGWCDGDDEECIEKAGQSRRFEEYYLDIEAFISSASLAKDILIAAGYPPNKVHEWIKSGENDFLRMLETNEWIPDGSPEIAFVDIFDQITAKANKYQQRNPKLPPVYFEAACGGDGGFLYTHFRAENLKKLYIIPVGYYKICSHIEKVNPNDTDLCEYWSNISLEQETPYIVKGRYRYKAIWYDGSITFDILDYDRNTGRSILITEIKE